MLHDYGLCEKCQKSPATVHMQQYMNGVKTELHLCQECSFKIDVPISLENIFQGFLDQVHTKLSGMPGQGQSTPTNNASQQPRKAPITTCTRCCMTYEQFKSSGKLGCEVCYTSFSTPVKVLIKNVQGSVRHEGKYPQRSGTIIKQKRQVDELRTSLKKAVDEENYEEAARLRDEIRSLEEM